MMSSQTLPRAQHSFVSTARPRSALRPAVARRSSRKGALVTRAAAFLVLVPTGEGTTEHLEQEKVRVPGMVTLRQGSYTLGRSEPSDIVLEVPTVSARHAQLEVAEKTVMVKDLESTNGTFIDERELESGVKHELRLGSEITFGDTFLCRFVLEERDEPKEE